MINITITDDQSIIINGLQKILADAPGIKIIGIFSNGDELLQGLETIQPDVMLLDIQMPVMNGFDFVEAFELLPGEVKQGYTVFMLSSSINENDLNRVKNYTSIKQFLNKPLTSSALSAILDSLEN